MLVPLIAFPIYDQRVAKDSFKVSTDAEAEFVGRIASNLIEGSALLRDYFTFKHLTTHSQLRNCGSFNIA
jgi:hypothetical protein